MSAPKTQAEAVAYYKQLAQQNATSLASKGEAEIVVVSEQAAVDMGGGS